MPDQQLLPPLLSPPGLSKRCILPAHLEARKLGNQTCLIGYKLHTHYWSHSFIHSLNKHFFSIFNQEWQASCRPFEKNTKDRAHSCIQRAEKPVGMESREYKHEAEGCPRALWQSSAQVWKSHRNGGKAIKRVMEGWSLIHSVSFSTIHHQRPSLPPMEFKRRTPNTCWGLTMDQRCSSHTWTHFVLITLRVAIIFIFLLLLETEPWRS